MTLKLSELDERRYKRKGDYDILINEKDNIEIVIVDCDFSFAVYKNGKYIPVAIFTDIEEAICNLAESYGWEVYHSASSQN